MIDLVVCGISGRMGRSLLRLIPEWPELQIRAGIGRAAADHDSPGGPPVVRLEDAADVIRGADVVIDFSAPEATCALLESAGHALAGGALVVGTTGLNDRAEELLEDVARRAAVLTAANFSIGVQLVTALAERMAARLGPDRYDVEIVEAHHGRKTDAPSGTALALGGAVARGRGAELAAVRRDGRSGRTGERTAGEIGFHAVRGGGVVGDHHVLFLGERERIELSHRALDRALFAEGALAAARWIAGRPPGRYSMEQVLDL